MNFNSHFDLIGRHAFLSPSNHYWINYDLEKLRDYYSKSIAQKIGTSTHDLARRLIEMNVPLPRNKKALNQYVNDAIGYRMFPEVILFYSYNAFGTTDSICFRNNLLRIHELKTGSTRVTMDQLEIYASLFCLEYEHKPNTIDIELRIYQKSSIIVHIPEPTHIRRIMEKIILFDKKIEEYRNEEDNPWMDME